MACISCFCGWNVKNCTANPERYQVPAPADMYMLTSMSFGFSYLTRSLDLFFHDCCMNLQNSLNFSFLIDDEKLFESNTLCNLQQTFGMV